MTLLISDQRLRLVVLRLQLQLNRTLYAEQDKILRQARHHVRTKSPHQVLPPRLRPVGHHAQAQAPAPDGPESHNRPVDGTVFDEMYIMW